MYRLRFMLVVPTMLLLLATSAWATGGTNIASAPAVVFGTQQFGNTATDNGETPCGEHGTADSWWQMQVRAGDKITVDWEGHGGKLLVFPTGTTDFNVTSTEPRVNEAIGGNGKQEVIFVAPTDGMMPVDFDYDCTFDNDHGFAPFDPGPYDFIATVKHGVVLLIRRNTRVRTNSTLKVDVHMPDGAVIDDPQLSVRVQLLVGRKWRTIGQAAVANSVARVKLALSKRLRGQRVKLRVEAVGRSYVTTTSKSMAVSVR